MAKKKSKNPLLTAVNVIIVLITILGALLCFLWVYFNTFGKDKVPTALTSTYVNTVTDPQTNERKAFIQVNVTSAEVGAGKNMVEVLFNSYTGTDKQALIGIGFQLIDGEVYYYNKVGATGFTPVVDAEDRFNQEEDVFLTDIDDKLFAIKLDGTHEVPLDLGIAGGVPVSIVTAITGQRPMIEESYTLEDFLKAIETTVRSNSNGTGEGTLSLVEMSSYLSIYDAETKEQISNEELGKYGLKNSYFSIDYTYSKTGVLFAEQSIFGVVKNDGEYNASGVDTNKNYWQAVTDINITEKDFEVRTSSVDGSEYLYLTTEAIYKLNLFKTVNIYIDINLDRAVNAVGFDYYALSGLKNIKSLKITSSTQKDFELLSDTLHGTGLSVEDIQTSNVNLIDKMVEVEVA